MLYVSGCMRPARGAAGRRTWGTPRRPLCSWLLLLSLLAAPAGAAAAPETRPLADLDMPGAWVPAQWNSAALRVALERELPPPAPADPDARSLAADVRWPAGSDFRFANLEPHPKPAPIPFRVLSLGLWVKGSGTAHSLEAHFADANGKDVKVGMGDLRSTDWRRLTARVPDDSAQPLTLRSLTLHNWNARGAAETRLLLAGLDASVDTAQRLVPGPDVPALTVANECENGLTPASGRASVLLRVSSWDAPAGPLEVRWRLSDWKGKSVLADKAPITLAGRWSKRVDVALPAFGAYTCTVEIWEPGRPAPLATARRRLARVVEPAAVGAAERARSSIGVNTHLGAPFAAFGRLGIHWARDYSWGWLGRAETAPVGKGLNFQEIRESADRAGVTVLPVLQGALRNSAGTAFIGDAAVIRETYRRLGAAFPQVGHWEVDNEAEYGFPGRRFQPANYENLIHAAADGLRAAAPAARVVLNGTAGIRYHDTVDLLRSPVRDDFAVVNYHYYTGAVPPEMATEDINIGGDMRREALAFLDQLRRINRLAHAAGKEAWLTEVGWDVANAPAVGERLQAVYLPRAYLLARLCGTDKVFWYYDRDVPGSTTRFGTCGILDLHNDARPSAAALANLSRYAALAHVGGSVDLGPDRWCVLLRQPAGDWVAAVWSVQGKHPLPEPLREVKGSDLFGNPGVGRGISPEVSYYPLATLPAAWEAQRHAEWLSLSTLVCSPGTGVDAEARAPAGAALAWGPLPAEITAGAWVPQGDRLISRLTCAPGLAPGEFPLRAAVQGAGWKREWPVSLIVLPPVRAAAEPYTPGDLTILRLRAAHEPTAVQVEVSADKAGVLPSSAALRTDRDTNIAVLPAAGARGPLPVVLRLGTGATHTLWLRPRAVDVPRLEKANLDGILSEWSEAHRWPGALFAASGEALPGEVRLGWSPEGLWIGARLDVKEPQSTNPREFWSGTNVEIYLDAAGGESGGWGSGAHQFWLCPVKEEAGWRLVAGEWKRGDAIPATLYDDRRCRTAMRATPAGFTFEALLPPEALGGRVPRAGDAWRAGLSLRSQGPVSATEAAWPSAKEDLLQGSQSWGVLRFAER